MQFTKKTFYGLGIVSAALTVLGGIVLIFSSYMSVIYNVASIAAGAMMLFLAPKQTEPLMKYTALGGALCVVLGMMVGTGYPAADVIGTLCGAVAWPVFAFGYDRTARTLGDDNVRTCADLVIAAGAVQLIGSFTTVLPFMLRVCLSIAIGVVQGVFVWTLFHNEG